MVGVVVAGEAAVVGVVVVDELAVGSWVPGAVPAGQATGTLMPRRLISVQDPTVTDATGLVVFGSCTRFTEVLDPPEGLVVLVTEPTGPMLSTVVGVVGAAGGEVVTGGVLGAVVVGGVEGVAGDDGVVRPPPLPVDDDGAVELSGVVDPAPPL